MKDTPRDSAAPNEGQKDAVPKSAHTTSRVAVLAFAFLALAQTFLAFLGAGDDFVVGHNGWNSSAYLQSARNTLRWGVIFPVQYYTGRAPPTPTMGYTHHPLAAHLHNTISVSVFGDTEGAIRAVPAFFGVMAVIALLSVVRRLWSDRTALIAGGIYVALPTNAIFVNMSNHESGLIAWMFLWGYSHVRFLEARTSAPERRWQGWYVLLLFAFFWAAVWDWPANYAALVFAAHWLSVLVARARRAGVSVLRARLDLLLLAVFCALALVVFAGHFLLVRHYVGSLSELARVYHARQVPVSTAALEHHITVVPILMFTTPILAMGLGWSYVRLWHCSQGRLERRDVIPLAFAVAGTFHYFIFRGTAVIHEYWGWTLCPAVAIGSARVVEGAVARLRAFLDDEPRLGRYRRAATLFGTATIITVLLGPLAVRALDLVPRGRAVGGSLWFIEPVRLHVEPYHSGRDLLRFAKFVKARTDRNVSVVADPALKRVRGHEPRFDITLDREIAYTPLQEDVPADTIYIAPRSALRDEELLALAARFPVALYEDFVVVDCRRDGRHVEAWRSEVIPRSGWDWYWRGPWSERTHDVRQLEDERALNAAVDAHLAKAPRPE